MSTDRPGLGRLLLAAVRDLPRRIHDTIEQLLHEQIRSTHGPLQVRPRVMICRTCNAHGLPMRWPCPTLVKHMNDRRPAHHKL